MKIENTTTEEITQLLCRVMESKEGQTDSEIIDEFEKQLKQKYCLHKKTRLHTSNLDAIISHGFRHEFKEGTMNITVTEICEECGHIVRTEKWYSDVNKIDKI